MVVQRDDLKSFIRDALSYNEDKIKLLSIKYRVFLMGLSGYDTSSMELAISNVKTGLGYSVDEQFNRLANDFMSDTVTSGVDWKRVKDGYKSSVELVLGSIRELRGLVNEVSLASLENAVRMFGNSVDVLYKCSNGINCFIELVDSQITNFLAMVDNLYDGAGFYHQKINLYNQHLAMTV